MLDVDFTTLIKGAVNDIEVYYHSSFKIPPERCMPFVVALIDKIDKIILGMTANQSKKMQDHLLKVLEAMQGKDYVLMRDILFYEIRSLLCGLPKNKTQLKVQH